MRQYYAAIFAEASGELARLIREFVVMEAVFVLVGALVGFALSDHGVSRALTTIGTAVVVFVVIVGLLGLWSLAWAPVNSGRKKDSQIDELGAYFKADVSHREALSTMGDLINEGNTLKDQILTGGEEDATLAAHRDGIKDWRQRGSAFLKEHTAGRDQGAAMFEHAFDRGSRSFEFRGYSYSGVRAELASAVDSAVWVLHGLTVTQPWYGEYAADRPKL